MTEAELQSELYQRLVFVHGEVVTTEFPAPYMGLIPDVVYYERETARLISFECKLRDWRKALQQAEIHSLMADVAYVYMPNRKISDAMRKAFCTVQKRGSRVGLCFPSRNEICFEVVLPSPFGGYPPFGPTRTEAIRRLFLGAAIRSGIGAWQRNVTEAK